MTLFFNRQALYFLWNDVASSSLQQSLFLLSVAVIIFCLITVSLLPFYLLNTHRFFAFLFLYLAATADFFTQKFGIIIDKNVTKSVFETTYQEASQFFNMSFFVWNLLFLIGAFAFVSILRPRETSFWRRLLKTGEVLAGVVLAFIFIALFFYKDYASFLRNHREFRQMINPINPVYQIGRYWKVRLFPRNTVFIPIGEGAVRVGATKSAKNKLVVFVLGETARGDHFSINGYSKNITTPQLSKEKVLSLKHVTACGTATAFSVPCIFSDHTIQNFNESDADLRGNLLDIAEKTGYHVTWVDNNTGCQGVCARANEINIEKFKTPELCQTESCFDEVLVHALKTLSQSPGDQFIVLHTLGSHGPSYFNRYPDPFKLFLPTCDTNDLSLCSQEQVVNTYDNTIAYTDHVLAEMIRYLKSISTHKDAMLVYVSDHGESLGENGIYLHSLPYAIAPKEQTTAAWLFWFSSDYMQRNDIKRLMASDTGNCQFNHDYIFSTMLGLLDIQAKEYDPSLDLLKIDMQLCKTNNR